MGPAVAQLEREIARLARAQHAIACASGTDALLLPLKAVQLRPGDEVITTPFTFFATAGTIHNAGGTPVFVDIEPETFNLDPTRVAAAITPRTRAVVPVHLYGQMVAMERLLPIAAASGLPIIEDAAQAIGARRRVDGQWRMAGELGWVTGFSFFPSKNLGAWGDGGMMVTSDAALAERLRRLRLHGGAKPYHHDEVGTNSRLDTLQAAGPLAKLPPPGARAAKPRGDATYSTRALAGLPVGSTGDPAQARRDRRRGVGPEPCPHRRRSGGGGAGGGVRHRRRGAGAPGAAVPDRARHGRRRRPAGPGGRGGDRVAGGDAHPVCPAVRRGRKAVPRGKAVRLEQARRGGRGAGGRRPWCPRPGGPPAAVSPCGGAAAGPGAGRGARTRILFVW